MTLGETIKSKRKNLRLTQEDLAGMIGVTKNAVCDWEKDYSDPSLSNIRNLSEFLECSVEELIYPGDSILYAGYKPRKKHILTQEEFPVHIIMGKDGDFEHCLVRIGSNSLFKLSEFTGACVYGENPCEGEDAHQWYLEINLVHSTLITNYFKSVQEAHDALDILEAELKEFLFPTQVKEA